MKNCVYSKYFLFSSSDVLCQWERTPQISAACYHRASVITELTSVLITEIIWLSNPYTAHDLTFILFRLIHDIGLALKALNSSLFDIQHVISERCAHFKNQDRECGREVLTRTGKRTVVPTCVWGEAGWVKVKRLRAYLCVFTVNSLSYWGWQLSIK